jgi:6,7-dimethyl-8-ribityllumazine synthase
MRIALVVSSYHDFVTSGLERGARSALRAGGLADDEIVTFTVPGAFELAQAAHRLAVTGGWQGIVCLGCLIRGETPHFDYIARAAADGIMRAAQDSGVPVTFGVLTTNTAEEALARSADGASNKGREAAAAALAMATLYAQLDAGGSSHG